MRSRSIIGSIIATAIISFVFRFPLKLAENAAVGWLNAELAEQWGSIVDGITWIVAIILAGLSMWLVFTLGRKERGTNTNPISSHPRLLSQELVGTRDSLIVPEATLHIYIGPHDFGTSPGGGGFPKDPVDTLWLRVYAVFNMSNTVLLQSIWLKLDNTQIQSDGWIAKTDEGLLQQNHCFAIPHSITPGKHNARMVVEADDNWWGSHTFHIEVPKR